MIKEIQCIELTKTYIGDGVKTNGLKNINLAFQKGEFTAVVGPSGSGKSTLLSLLGTLDKPSSGQILYNDEELIKKSSRKIADFRFKEIGFIFQQFNLLPTLTALENVLTPLFARKVSYNKDQRAKEVLDRVGLSDKFNSLPSQLSGGQQQRVAIARAIVHQPSWLLADEPTGNLDTHTSNRIFDLMKDLNEKEGCGVIFVTHDPILAAGAHRIIEMKDSQVITDRKGEK